MLLIQMIFWIAVFVVVWAMVGYPASLIILKKVLRLKTSPKRVDFEPTVTVMVVAHNEENVIEEKLNNLSEIDYPIDKIDILIASDCSTDKTNDLVREYIKNHNDRKISIYESIEHKGKTNAQNEAQKKVTSEILVMTDANSMFEKNAVREIVSSFTANDISYVTGRLQYVNDMEKKTAEMESIYWRMDLKCREVESDLQTITAGNGAIYACRNDEYIDFNPIECHDASMPLRYALDCKRAIYNKDAVAYEKAGEIDADEFKRKVRMNREILRSIFPDARLLNIFKYKWFSYFYFGHRTCRYLLWIGHFLAFICNLLLVNVNLFYSVTMCMQVLFYLIAIIKKQFNVKGKIFHIVYFYCMTVMAQWYGVFNIITGKAKPTWEKAESTR